MVVHRDIEGTGRGAQATPVVASGETTVDELQADTAAGLAHAVRRLYGRQLHVLLVIDDEDEAALFADAAEESVLDVGIEVVAGVDEAAAHIQRAIANRRRKGVPDVVVSALDIDESHRLLAALRSQTQDDVFPVVILSDDGRPGLERRSFALGASGHLRAPERRYERVALIHTLPDFLPQLRVAE